MLKTILAVLLSLSFTFTAGAIGTPAKGDPKTKSNALVKRMVANLSPKDFTAITGKKLNFLTRIAYKKMRRQFRRELTAAGLQNDYDTLYLADGSIVTGIILANTPSGIKYKSSSDEDSELKELAVAQVNRISVAKSVTTAWEGEDVPIEKTATASMWLGIFGFVSIFIPFLNLLTFFAILASLILGITALNKIKKSNGKLRGEGRAIAGIVISGIYLLLLIVAIVLIVGLIGWGG
jgi:Domain of unknown function (DUF4190)